MKHICNKINIIYKLCFLPWVLIANCKGIPQDNNYLEIIDIESNIKNFKEIFLSNYKCDIHYVLLRNDKNLAINSIYHLDFTSDLLLMSNSDLCLIYDYSGRIIAKIGEKGRGPHDYVAISNSNFGFNNNIFIQNRDYLLEFKTNGSFIKSFNIKKGKEPSFYLSSWIPINDSLLFGQIPLSTGKEKNKAFLFDTTGNTIQYYSNYIFLKRTTLGFSSDDGQASFYRFQNKIHFKELMNDTLYCLTERFSLKPLMSFRIGKYSKPKEFREKLDFERNNAFNYVYVNKIFEIEDYLFIDCQFGKHTPAKRITPSLFMGQEQWYNTTNVLGVYNKQTKKLVFCNPTSTDNPLFTTGICNDIDAGPRFYPVKQVNDSTLVMWIDAKQLKEHVASADFKNNIPKYPEKKKELEELANKLSIFDNPVLMFVTFKK